MITNSYSQEWISTPSSADRPPRKVILGSVMRYFMGDLDQRLTDAEESIDMVMKSAKEKYGGKMDMIVLPEHALCKNDSSDAQERAVMLEGAVLERMGKKAREYHTYVVITMYLDEKEGKITNVAVLLDREGKVAGIYRKAHPVVVPQPSVPEVVGKLSLEGGTTPGNDFPVFDCDFGKVGFQICWDGFYEDGWRELARKGAEIIAAPSACPHNVRLASYAVRGRYYIITSTIMDNIALFTPIGVPIARETQESYPVIMVQQIDLSYARLPWSPNLNEGKLLADHFGDKAGYLYSRQEVNALFWSNDPQMPVEKMTRQLNLVELEKQIELSTELRPNNK